MPLRSLSVLQYVILLCPRILRFRRGQNGIHVRTRGGKRVIAWSQNLGRRVTPFKDAIFGSSTRIKNVNWRLRAHTGQHTFNSRHICLALIHVDTSTTQKTAASLTFAQKRAHATRNTAAIYYFGVILIIRRIQTRYAKGSAHTRWRKA